MLIIQPRTVVLGTTNTTAPSLSQVEMEPHRWAKLPKALYGRIIFRVWEIRTSGTVGTDEDKVDFELLTQPGFENTQLTSNFPGWSTDLLGSSLKGMNAANRMTSASIILDPRTTAQTLSTMLFWRVRVINFAEDSEGVQGNWAVMFDITLDPRA